MDFARRQLEKYGWTDGKGLGKKENGISEALKPKLKRSVTGIGHDAASDFTEHWWTQLYNKAASNVEVEEKGGRTNKIKTKDNQFKITNSTYHLSKKTDSKEKQEEYSDFFVKTAVLTNGGSKVEKVRESESEEEGERKDVFKMTDEELFAACEGRTAHKGARHGLKATGKLARIERQEKLLLVEAKYNGYSHTMKAKNNENNASDFDMEVIEHTNLEPEDRFNIKKMKKKRKRCVSIEMAASHEPLPDETQIEEKNSCFSDVVQKHKKSKSKIKNLPVDEFLPEEKSDEMAGNSIETSSTLKQKSKKAKRTSEVLNICETKSSQKHKGNILDTMETDAVEVQQHYMAKIKKKKKKNKMACD